MRFLIIGHSSIVSRRALPALLAQPGIQSVDIASRRPLQHALMPSNWTGRIFGDYREAISESQADVIYVSLVNSLHENWVEAALESGKHVIVDKPAFLSFSATERLVELAAKNDLCLVEAFAFSCHPQIAELQRLLSQHGGATRLISTFTFPPPSPESYLNHPELGGGSLYDQGPYTASVSRLFFGDFPLSVSCNVVSRHSETNVDTAFSILAAYDGRRSYVGHFGFDTEYQNRLTIIGPSISITVDRVFSTPPDFQTELDVVRSNERTKIKVKAADSFGLFFAKVIESIQNHSWSMFAEEMLSDARFMGIMRSAALSD